MKRLVFADMKEYIFSKLFYVGLAVLLAWFWYVNKTIPVYVTDFTEEERDVMEAYQVQPEAPWITPGMSREEMKKAFEESFSDPPEVDGTVWQVFSGEGYSIQVPLGYYRTEEHMSEEGRDDIGFLPERQVQQWFYDEDSKDGGRSITFSVYPNLPMKPEAWENANRPYWITEEILYNQLRVRGKEVLFRGDGGYVTVWIKGNNGVWFEITTVFEDDDELWEKVIPAQQALLKYIVYSFTIF